MLQLLLVLVSVDCKFAKKSKWDDCKRLFHQKVYDICRYQFINYFVEINHVTGIKSVTWWKCINRCTFYDIHFIGIG